MKNYVLLCKVTGVIIIICTVLAIVLWFFCITDGGPIEGTGFVDMQRPVASSGNFDVDSEENIYFAKQDDGTIQIYDKEGKYLYSLDIGRTVVNELEGKFAASLRIRIFEGDMIEVLLVRSRKSLIYNSKGFLEEVVEGPTPMSSRLNKIKSDYEVERNGVTYYARPKNNFFTSIVREENGVETVVFQTPPIQMAHLIIKIIAIVSTAFLLLISVINRYIKQKNKKKEAGEE